MIEHPIRNAPIHVFKREKSSDELSGADEMAMFYPYGKYPVFFQNGGAKTALERAEEFQRKAVAYQQDVNQKRGQLERAIANAQAEVDRALRPIRQKILQDTGATMLMDKTLVLEQVPGLDVTTRMIEQLDISLPSITVVLPPIAEAPAGAPAVN